MEVMAGAVGGAGELKDPDWKIKFGTMRFPDALVLLLSTKFEP